MNSQVGLVFVILVLSFQVILDDISSNMGGSLEFKRFIKYTWGARKFKEALRFNFPSSKKNWVAEIR